MIGEKIRLCISVRTLVWCSGFFPQVILAFQNSLEMRGASSLELDRTYCVILPRLRIQIWVCYRMMIQVNSYRSFGLTPDSRVQLNEECLNYE